MNNSSAITTPIRVSIRLSSEFPAEVDIESANDEKGHDNPDKDQVIHVDTPSLSYPGICYGPNQSVNKKGPAGRKGNVNIGFRMARLRSRSLFRGWRRSVLARSVPRNPNWRRADLGREDSRRRSVSPYRLQVRLRSAVTRWRRGQARAIATCAGGACGCWPAGLPFRRPKGYSPG